LNDSGNPKCDVPILLKMELELRTYLVTVYLTSSETASIYLWDFITVAATKEHLPFESDNNLKEWFIRNVYNKIHVDTSAPSIETITVALPDEILSPKLEFKYHTRYLIFQNKSPDCFFLSLEYQIPSLFTFLQQENVEYYYELLQRANISSLIELAMFSGWDLIGVPNDVLKVLREKAAKQCEVSPVIIEGKSLFAVLGHLVLKLVRMKLVQLMIQLLSMMTKMHLCSALLIIRSTNNLC
jgi:hypothetical protein